LASQRYFFARRKEISPRLQRRAEGCASAESPRHEQWQRIDRPGWKRTTANNRRGLSRDARASLRRWDNSRIARACRRSLRWVRSACVSSRDGQGDDKTRGSRRRASHRVVCFVEARALEKRKGAVGRKDSERAWLSGLR